ncbi:MAG TPA: hypothetical protein VMM78_02555, partial [Thermomicrobiales bacterium]|nr:hypothetical protein [Thermomicrobiales bacterium]
LLAGPFLRRDLVVYKFCVYFFGACVNAAIIALILPRSASTGLAAFVASALTLLFVQMASTAMTLCNLMLDSAGGTRWRRRAALFAIIGVGLWILYTSLVSGPGLVEIIRQFRHSPTGELLLAPFVVFTRILLSRELAPELITWASAGIAINAALLCAIVALDRRTFEQSLIQSSRASKRWQRMLRGGPLMTSQKTSGRSLGRAPYLLGIGPIAWRQAINAYRNGGRIIAVFTLVAIITGPILAITTAPDEVMARVAVVFLFATFVLPKALVLDFRAELDSLELYKALPLSACQICIGQLVVAMLVSSAIELVLFVSAWFFLAGDAARWLALAALFLMPFNLLLYGLENLVCLLLPARPVPVGRVDFEFMGRTLAEYFGKVVILIATLAAAAALGLKVLAATGEYQAALATVWLTLAAPGVVLVGLCALAFRRFQVSDTTT